MHERPEGVLTERFLSSWSTEFRDCFEDIVVSITLGGTCLAGDLGQVGSLG